MPDFDMPGIGKARMGLTELARSPAKRDGPCSVKRSVVKELYTEIRAARLAGHSWIVIQKQIVNNVKVSISPPTLAAYFAEIDKRYEAETGVKALPVKNTKRKRGRTGKAFSEAAPEPMGGE